MRRSALQRIVLSGSVLGLASALALFAQPRPTLAAAGDAPTTWDRGTILADDPLPSISISDVSIAEGSGGVTHAFVALTLSDLSGLPVAVNYATADGTASAGSDYAPDAATIVFAPGQVAAVIDVSIFGDGLDEPDETFTVNLSAPVNATIADAVAEATILDDDSRIEISINDWAGGEGNSGLLPATFTVTLSQPNSVAVTVDYVAAGIFLAANPTEDFLPASGTLVFNPGETTKTVTVEIVGDRWVEASENFAVLLSNATNAVIADAMGLGGLFDDDPVLLQVSGVNVPEGDSGTTPATFTISPLDPLPYDLEVDYRTFGNFFTTAGVDFVPAIGTFTLPAGTTSHQVTVDVIGDTNVEFLEGFGLEVTNGTDGVASIVDDDQPLVTISDASVTEGAAGTATFSITLDRPSIFPVTVDFATADGTARATSFLNPNFGDYTTASGTLTFAAGETSKMVVVDVLDDVVDEDDQAFTVELSNASNATISDASGTGTIVDDDAQPTLSIEDSIIPEGDVFLTSRYFHVTLSGPTERLATYDIAVRDGTATSPDDFRGGTGTPFIQQDVTEYYILVFVQGDTLDEDNETFTVDLTNGTKITILDGHAVGTIDDDDPIQTISIDNVSVAEGDSGTTTGTFTVTLSAPRLLPVTVDYATLGLGATPGSDFVPTVGTVTFAPGETVKTITVEVLGDTEIESDEAFGVVLSHAAFAVIDQGQGTATIVDDDLLPTVSIGDVAVTEGNAGTTQAALTVTLSAPMPAPVTVRYATADSSAVSPADFAAASGTLTFVPGETAKEVRIDIVGDVLDEANETFAVDLTDATNATIADTFAVVTITDDDAPPTLCVNDSSAIEGDRGTTPLAFSVCLSNPSGKAVSVSFATANGTAVAGADYTATSGTVTIPAGATTAQVSVPVRGDATDEVNETFTLNLSNPANATVADGTGIGTIVDDDPKPVITSLNPGSLPQGGMVTIRGSGFTGATQVAFARAGGGTVNATTFTVVNDGRVTATVPSLATTGRVSVTTAAGAGTSPINLLIEPRISGFAPAAGPVGTVVTINGTAFTGVTAVRFGQTSATVFTVVSDTQIRATVPAGARTAKIDVVTPGGSDSSMGKFTVQ